jgi:hypothetical protein
MANTILVDKLPPLEKVKKLKELEEKLKKDIQDEEVKLTEEKDAKLKELSEMKKTLAKSLTELELDERRARDEGLVRSLIKSESLDAVLTLGSLDPVTMKDFITLFAPPNSFFHSDMYKAMRPGGNAYLSLDDERRFMSSREQSFLLHVDAYARPDMRTSGEFKSPYAHRSEEVLRRRDDSIHKLHEDVYNLNKLVGEHAIYK